MPDTPPAAVAETPATATTTDQPASSAIGNLLAGAEGTAVAASTTPAEGEQPAPEGADTATAEDATAKPEGAPEAYADFVMPEGIALKPETLTDFAAFAKTKNMSQDDAQEVLAFGIDKLKEAAEAPYKLWHETQKQWQDDMAKDPEIGGAWGTKESPGAAQIAARKAIDNLGGDALRNALNITGAGNNPDVVRAFVKMGKLLSEPGFATGGSISSGPKSMAEVMYPDQKPT